MKKTIMCILIGVCISTSFAHSQEDFAKYVDPFIGTSDDHGQTNPAAVVPFGMIKPGPDTKPAGQSGYNYLAEEITGFSQTRISGIGCTGAGGNLRLLPFIGSPQPTEKINKNKESASAGYYSVEFQNGIKVEVTTGRTTAIYRFTYPETQTAGLSLDLQSSFAAFKGEKHTLLKNNIVEGHVKGAGTCEFGVYKFYYHIEVDKLNLSTTENDGKLYWNFKTNKNESITVRVSLSTVSEENAKLNMLAELGSKSFEKVKELAYNAWEEELSVLKVQTKDKDLKISFYTRLYHAYLNPSNIKDYSSEYTGSDGKAYSTARNHYHGWSIWDTFRTKHPLFTIIQPDKYKDIIYSLVKLYKQGKPDWATESEPFPTVRTEHAIILLLDALNKGLVEKELIELIMSDVLQDAENIPGDSPDKILERCYDYWAISELAKHLNLSTIQKQFLEKSKEYRTVWDEKFKIITDKSDIMHGDGLYEGTLWQYRWFVPHDVEWITNTIGSKKETISQLDYFFDNNLFNMGNQPDIQAPYLYYNLGEPWKTQKLVRKMLLEPTENYYGTHDKWKAPYIGKIFKTTPDGYLKEMDDDAGTMSSWFVLSSIGLFPVCPGVPYYWIQSPLFDSVTIKLGGGKTLQTEVLRKSEKDIFIQSVSLNGINKMESWLSYSEIMNGGKLVIQLSDTPHKDWGQIELKF